MVFGRWGHEGSRLTPRGRGREHRRRSPAPRVFRLWLIGTLLWAWTAAALAEPTFRAAQGRPPVRLSRAVLTDAERSFLAGLPEIRVALQRVGAPPYEVVGPGDEVHGFQAEMLVLLARTFGLRIRPVIYEDWPSVLRAVREREADMVLTLGVNSERLKYLAFTLGTVSVPVAVFARQGQPTPALDDARIAIERGYWTEEIVRRQFPGATLQTVDSTVQALQAVAAGGSDVYVGSLLEAVDTLTRRAMPGLEVRQLLQTGAGFYHFGVRKDWATLATVLNRGISSLRVPTRELLDAGGAVHLPAGRQWRGPISFDDGEAALLEQRAVWRVGAVRGLPMINDYSPQGLHSGIAAEYTEQVAQRLGVGLDTVAFDNVGAMIDALRAGHIDVVPFLTRTEERAAVFGFSEPYFEMPYVLVARTDAPMYWDLGSLRGRTLALAAQHPLRALLAQRYPEIRIVEAADGNEAMDLVAAGQADASVEVKVFANLRINGDGGLRLRSLGSVPELPSQFHFATAPQARGLVPLIDRALQDIPVSEHERIRRRWVAIDLVAPFAWQRWMPTIVVAAAALALFVGGTAWWARRLSREVHRRRRSDEQLDDIARTLPGLAFRYVVDPDGRVVRSFFSSGTAAFLGLVPRPGQTVLDAVADRLSDADRENATQLQTQSFRSGEPFRCSAMYHHPDGRQRWMQVQAVRSSTRDGFCAWTGYVIDASVEHQLQQQLAHEAEERYLMLASASHELRAPTHTLALALQAVPAADVAPRHRHNLKIAADAARTLAQLLDDVLDAARASFGRLELRPQAFDLHTLMMQTADAHAGAAAAKGLLLLPNIADDVPRTVHADPLRLRQVLTNLLSNAVKYTDSGGVHLSVARDTLPGGAPALCFTVLDSGPGIAPELQRRLFEPFAAGEGAGGSAEPGARSTGLGLSVCRRLVALMQGRIDIDSRPGEGTTVRVRVPLLQPRSTGMPREGAVLVCDDDPVSRLLLAEALRARGLSVVEVGSAQAALSRWREGGVRLLVTDLSMPGGDGLSLVASLRAEEPEDGSQRTPVVVCSGNPPPAHDGPPPYDAFIAKPVDMKTLIDTLETLGLSETVA